MSPFLRTPGRTAFIVTLVALVAAVGWGVWRTRSPAPASVYFVTYEAPDFSLTAVPRTHLSQDVEGDPLTFSVERVAALVAGPTAQEQRSGLSTAVPEGTVVRAASFRDGELTLDLSGAFALGGGTASMLGRLEQVRWTLTEPELVERLTLRMEGEPLDLLGGEGLWLDPTWSRLGAVQPRW